MWKLFCKMFLIFLSVMMILAVTMPSGIVQSQTGNYLRSLAISPDGKFLAGGGSDRTIKIWDIATGKLLKILSGHQTAVTAVAFSPDGNFLATVSHAEGLIKLWNTEAFGEIWSSEVLRKDMSRYSNDQRHTISFSSDSKYLAVGKSRDEFSSSDSDYLLTPIPTPKPSPKPVPKVVDESSEDYEKRKKEFEEKRKAEEEKRVAKEIENRLKEQRKFAVDIWNVREGKKVKEFLGHKSDVPFVTFTDKGKFLISGSRDKTVRIWDVEAEKEVKIISGITETMQYLSLSKSNKFIAGTFSKEGKVWDFLTGEELIRVKTGNDEIVEFSADEKLLLILSNTSITRWDFNAKKEDSKLNIFYDRWMTEAEKETFETEFYKELNNKDVIKIRNKYKSLLAKTTTEENQKVIVERFDNVMKTYFEKWRTKYGIEAANLLARISRGLLSSDQVATPVGMGSFVGSVGTEFNAVFNSNTAFFVTAYENNISLWDWKLKKRIARINLLAKQ